MKIGFALTYIFLAYLVALFIKDMLYGFGN